MSDSQLIQVVAEDLLFLKEEWDQTVSDRSLRITSPVLRRLLIHNDYGNAWRAVGFEKQPRVRAVDLKIALRGVTPWKIGYAQAGGAHYKGVHVGIGLLQQGYGTPNRAGTAESTRDFWLSEFVDSHCLVIQGVWIKRRKLIEYFANKMGGDHFDPKRNPLKDMAFVLLDSDTFTSVVLDKPGLYFELLSIGQAMANSEDVERFLERVAE